MRLQLRQNSFLKLINARQHNTLQATPATDTTQGQAVRHRNTFTTQWVPSQTHINPKLKKNIQSIEEKRVWLVQIASQFSFTSPPNRNSSSSTQACERSRNTQTIHIHKGKRRKRMGFFYIVNPSPLTFQHKAFLYKHKETISTRRNTQTRGKNKEEVVGLDKTYTAQKHSRRRECV